MPENAQKLSEKLRTKIPATKRGYSMAKIVPRRHGNAFSEVFEREASPAEVQSQ